MAFQNTSSTNSSSQNWMQVNDLARDIKSKERVTIYKDDAGTRRVLEGKGADGFYGLKVSPAEVDVYTATDDQLIFNSGQNVLKIVQTGTATIPSTTIPSTTTNGTSSVIITHNLGFKPVVIAYVTDTYGNLSPLPAFTVYSGFVDTGGGFPYVMPLNQYVISSSGTNTVTFTNYITNSDYPLGMSYAASAKTIKYYFMQESAA